MGKEGKEGKCCQPWFAWLVLVVGVLFLLQDLGVWMFPVSGWTALFVLAGLSWVVKSS